MTGINPKGDTLKCPFFYALIKLNEGRISNEEKT